MSKRFEAGTEGLLIAIFTDTAQLDGAACVGRHDLFDAADPTEDDETLAFRHRAAATICNTCPALDACRDWAAGERPTDAILAGQRNSQKVNVDSEIRSDSTESELRNEQTA